MPPILFRAGGPLHRNQSAQGQKRGVSPFMAAVTPTLGVRQLVIAGITRDETGAAVAGFTVYLFNMASGTPVLWATTVSDATGAYSFSVGGGQPYWAVDYKAGTPDKAGASLPTLMGGA